MPTDSKLKPLYCDSTFWVLLAMSLPGIAAAYLSAWHGIKAGAFNADEFTAGLMAAPIVVYLGIGRQIARKASIDNAAAMAAVDVSPADGDAIEPGHEDFVAEPLIAGANPDEAIEAVDAEGER